MYAFKVRYDKMGYLISSSLTNRYVKNIKELFWWKYDLKDLCQKLHITNTSILKQVSLYYKENDEIQNRDIMKDIKYNIISQMIDTSKKEHTQDYAQLSTNDLYCRTKKLKTLINNDKTTFLSETMKLIMSGVLPLSEIYNRFKRSAIPKVMCFVKIDTATPNEMITPDDTLRKTLEEYIHPHLEYNYKQIWDECKDNMTTSEVMKHFFDNLMNSRERFETPQRALQMEIYKSIKDRQLPEDEEFGAMNEFFNSLNQSSRSANGYIFQRIIYMSLVATSYFTHNDILFEYEVEFQKITKNIEYEEKRQVDILACKSDKNIIISCKGGGNNTQTEDDVIKQYVSKLYLPFSLFGKKVCVDYGYIVCSHSNYTNREYIEFSNGKDSPKEFKIYNLYDAIKLMFENMVSLG